jgi:hypothetical protein
MTMFSMKPKFNLAEFLAVPASAGARNAKRRGMQFRPAATPHDAAKPAQAEASDLTENPKK